jgi:hypothetical protein
MADKNQLPDWNSKPQLAKQIREFPRPLIAAFAFRIALLALPGLRTIDFEKPKHENHVAILRTTLRALAASLVAAKRPTQSAAYADFAASRYIDASGAENIGTSFVASRAAGFAAFAAHRSAVAVADAGSAARSAAAAATYDAARHAATVVASFAETASDSSEELYSALIEQAMRDMNAAKVHLESASWFLSRPIFDEAGERERYLSPLMSLFERLPESDGWSVWRHWVYSRYFGLPDWPKPVYDEIIKWQEEWDRPPAEINRDIAELLQKHGAKLHVPPTTAIDNTFSGWDFFLSYSNKDETAAKAIDDVLRAAGYRVFFQLRNMDTGASYIRRMKDGLAGSKRLIAVMSPDYEKSDHCQNEWGAFYDKDPSFNQRLMVHLVVRGPVTDRLAKQSVYVSVENLSGSDFTKAVLHAIGHKHT